MKLILNVMSICFLLSGLAYADDGFKWRDMRKACKADHESVACLEQKEKARAYCVEHADKKRCRKMKALKECKNNPNSDVCQEHKEKFKAYCAEHPGAKKMRSSTHTRDM